ncbi:MAG: hypothetical protein M1832_002380 [Thelocarpon impressellum]|nr:MAG: hypothetical protein M1832_002380 [Thelocarpon impressellum]
MSAHANNKDDDEIQKMLTALGQDSASANQSRTRDRLPQVDRPLPLIFQFRPRPLEPLPAETEDKHEARAWIAIALSSQDSGLDLGFAQARRAAEPWGFPASALYVFERSFFKVVLGLDVGNEVFRLREMALARRPFCRTSALPTLRKHFMALVGIAVGVWCPEKPPLDLFPGNSLGSRVTAILTIWAAAILCHLLCFHVFLGARKVRS